MKAWTPLLALTLSSVLLIGCSDDDDDGPSASNGGDNGSQNGSGNGTDPGNGAAQSSYEITVINLTNNQPLSPVAVISHSAAYSAWAVGSAASVGLEKMAEGGDNSDMIGADLEGLDATGASGTAPIGPGGSETIVVTSSADTQTLLTVATMLVNTNDAFAGVGSIDVSGLAPQASLTFTAPVYDAGTEANSEASGTIPGPADGGEGYNSARDDRDRVARHGGVVTADDGLTGSALDQSHRFDNPAMRITITRR